ncbi:anti-sigma factor domain-containing protein [Streptomyces sp. NPDC002602]|uniref:anti-sigma factor n=1 Tax=Streptomyces sp. NPDC002602 TaxID=3364654 RepID=UPI00367FA3EF
MKHDDELHALIGAYALDALTGDEHDRFTRHLRDCEACRTELPGFLDTAGRLATAVAHTPPEHLKEAVLHRIDSVRRLPPRVPEPVTPTGAFALARGKAWGYGIAAGIAAAAVLGGVTVWEGRQAEQAHEQALRLDSRNRDLSAVITASDARTVRGALGTGATATLVTSRERGRAVVIADRLPPPPQGRTYQLWFSDGGTMRPAGHIDRSGAVLLTGDIGAATAVGVTLEPAGGSPRPTGSPLLLLSLPA